jgi:hypothetical protein
MAQAARGCGLCLIVAVDGDALTVASIALPMGRAPARVRLPRPQLPRAELVKRSLR